MKKLITFIVPSRNLDNLKNQFDQFEATTFDLDAIEFLVKLDTDQPGVHSFVEDQTKKRKFSIKFIITPRLGGTFSLWIAIEQLFSMVSQDSYFVQVLSDEPYYLTPHWDKVLQQYMHFFPDNVFRLRLSSVKYANYASHYECAFRCDSFPIYTRKWLELTEGIGDCWGSDAYQQCVAYHLCLGPKGYYNYHREQSLWRDIPISDIKMGGLEFGVGVDSEMQKERHFRNLMEWKRLSSFKMQERFSYLARRIYCYIWACKNYNKPFTLVPDTEGKFVIVLGEHDQEIFQVSYKLQRHIVFLQNLERNIKTNYYIYILARMLRMENHLSTIKKIILLPFKIARWMLSKLKRFILKLLNKEDFAKSKKRNYKHLHTKGFLYNERKNELVYFNPPDIYLLFRKINTLPPGVKTPTPEDIEFGKSTIKHIQEQRFNYRNKLFTPNQ